MDNKITFYVMEGCGHCNTAKNTLMNEIKNGIDVLKSQSEAPSNVRGFPHFEYKDRSMSGAPASAAILFKELDYKPNKSKENYDGWIGVTSGPEMYSNLDSWSGVM